MNTELKNKFMKNFHDKYSKRNTKYNDKGKKRYIIRKVEDYEEPEVIENGIKQFEDGEVE